MSYVRNSSEACAMQETQKPNKEIDRLENQSSTLGLLVTTVECISISLNHTDTAKTYPNSKCLQRFRASCFLVLQAVHSRRRTTFLVVLAFLWKTGLV